MCKVRAWSGKGKEISRQRGSMWEDPVAALRNEIRLACQGEVLQGEGFLFSNRINTKLLNI